VTGQAGPPGHHGYFQIRLHGFRMATINGARILKLDELRHAILRCLAAQWQSQSNRQSEFSRL